MQSGSETNISGSSHGWTIRWDELILVFPVIFILLIFLFACAPPVLKKEVLEEAKIAIPSEIKADPDAAKGRLFVLGGILVNVKNQTEGSIIEGIFAIADKKGYLKEGQYAGRFIAKSREFLDPMIYKAGRSVTIAGEFTGFEKGKIGEMEYDYPVFNIKELYLWPEDKPYLVPPPWWYDPWYYPWWYDPWWRYRYPY